MPAGLLSAGYLPPLLALLVYSPVLSHGLLWDDSLILERQLPALRLEGLLAPPAGLYGWSYHYYRPVTALSLLVDGRLYGTGPLGFHVTVWLLHAATSYAVFRLGRRLLPPRGAVLAASLFAVYPLSAECVGWIAGRADVLAGLFGVAAGAASLRGPQTRSRGEDPVRGETLSLAALSLFFLAALLSKESAVALAPFPLAAAWLSGSAGRRLARTAVAVAAPIAGWMAMRAWLNPPPASEGHPGEGGWDLMAGSIAYFPVRLVFPFFGPAYRPLPPSDTLTRMTFLLLASCALGLGLWAWRRRRTALLLALLWVAATVLTAAVAASWSVTRTPAADRLLYLPAVGWCLLLGALFAGAERERGDQDRESHSLEREPAARQGGESRSGAAKRPERRERPGAPGDPRGALRSSPIDPAYRRGLRLATGWLLVALFAWASVVRTPVYADDLAYWSAAVRSEPESGVAMLNLGYAREGKGEFEGAAAAYREALRRPLSPADRTLALTSLGAALYRTGRWAESEQILRKAAALPEADSTARFNLGALLYQKALRDTRGGRPHAARATLVEAQAFLELAVRDEASHTKALMLLGHCYLSAGRSQDARRVWSRILEIEGRDGLVGREATMALERLP